MQPSERCAIRLQLNPDGAQRHHLSPAWHVHTRHVFHPAASFDIPMAMGLTFQAIHYASNCALGPRKTLGDLESVAGRTNLASPGQCAARVFTGDKIAVGIATCQHEIGQRIDTFERAEGIVTERGEVANDPVRVHATQAVYSRSTASSAMGLP